MNKLEEQTKIIETVYSYADKWGGNFNKLKETVDGFSKEELDENIDTVQEAFWLFYQDNILMPAINVQTNKINEAIIGLNNPADSKLKTLSKVLESCKTVDPYDYSVGNIFEEVDIDFKSFTNRVKEDICIKKDLSENTTRKINELQSIAKEGYSLYIKLSNSKSIELDGGYEQQ